MTSHEDLLTHRWLPWAAGADDVRGIAMVGSRVRTDRPADEWSDLDLVLLTRDPERYVETEWLDEIAPHWLELTHPGPIPGFPVRQVLFEGALDCDIVPVPSGQLQHLVDTQPAAALVLADGWVPLIDKDGELEGLRVLPRTSPAARIDVATYNWTIRNFLFQSVWTAKHLRRGEVWLPKDDVDSYMKRMLLLMIEWHARLHGRDVASWGEGSGGRLLETWADPWVLGALGPTFASYDAADVGRALLEMMGLFRRIGEEVGARLGCPYPGETHDTIEGWVRGCLEEGGLSPATASL